MSETSGGLTKKSNSSIVNELCHNLLKEHTISPGFFERSSEIAVTSSYLNSLQGIRREARELSCRGHFYTDPQQRASNSSQRFLVILRRRIVSGSSEYPRNSRIIFCFRFGVQTKRSLLYYSTAQYCSIFLLFLQYSPPPYSITMALMGNVLQPIRL